MTATIKQMHKTRANCSNCKNAANCLTIQPDNHFCLASQLRTVFEFCNVLKKNEFYATWENFMNFKFQYLLLEIKHLNLYIFQNFFHNTQSGESAFTGSLPISTRSTREDLEQSDLSSSQYMQCINCAAALSLPQINKYIIILMRLKNTGYSLSLLSLKYSTEAA